MPLVEICVLVGIVLIAIGFLSGDDGRRTTALIAGMALASVAGLEVAMREHLTGYRSHSSLLAGALALALGVGVALAGAYVAGVVTAVIAFPLAFVGMRRLFRRKAGVPFRA